MKVISSNLPPYPHILHTYLVLPNYLIIHLSQHSNFPSPMPIIECVPNFSEGQNPAVIEKIASSIREVEGVQLLHVDPGFSAHRTVMTFVGEPEAVVEAAFRAIRTAAAEIDMRRHKGTHPRMGATDVCPLVPIQGVSLEEVVAYAQKLGERVGRELGIPVYLYEAAASQPHRRNLAAVRSGEYEGWAEKIKDPAWQPDFGPASYNAKAGHTVIGARPFLVAYNLNLNTRSVPLANAVAFDIREIGRVKKIDGETVRDKQGKALRIPGACPGVKAIGWYIEEYGIAQVSTNVTDLDRSALHEVFEAGREAARKRGLRVTGSELIGLIPERALLEAGRFYLERQGGESIDKDELFHIATRTLGLAELGPFDPRKRIIELTVGV